MVTCKGHVVVRSMAIVLYACDAIIAVDLQLSGLLIFRDVHDAVHRHTHRIGVIYLDVSSKPK